MSDTVKGEKVADIRRQAASGRATEYRSDSFYRNAGSDREQWVSPVWWLRRTNKDSYFASQG